MKALPYVLNRRAVADLEYIWFYTAERWSEAQAERYYALIFEEINYICKNTDSGKNMDHIREGFRASKVKSHLIFYRIVNDTVVIVRILHERMDIDSQLGD